MENRMTAVEWLVEQTESLITIETFQKWQSLKKQAKAMEKEQIMDDFNAGQWAWAEHLNGKEKKDPLEYYNETYGNSKTPPGAHCEEA